MKDYHDWTATQVRDWIEEAAATVLKLPKDYGPKGSGNCFPEIVREKWKDAAGETVYRSRPTGREISRMETVWTWINALHEDERRLLYGWGEAKMSRNRRLRYFAEENSISERTLLRAVTRVCQRIADDLNRKREIRLTMPFDGVSEICDPVRDFNVASKNCAKPPRSKTFTGHPEKLTHDSSPEAVKALGRHLAAINRRRQNQARRKAERDTRKRKRAA